MRTTINLVTLAALGLSLGSPIAAASAVADPIRGTERGAQPTQTSTAKTRLVFEIADCEGCTVQLTNARMPRGASRPKVWQSQERFVEDGQVEFTVASRRTWGMSTAIRAPWEGETGYITTVVQRYEGHAVGDPVSVEDAKSQQVATSCWAGTRSDEVTIGVSVEEVTVDGIDGEVPGTLAFVEVTQDWQGHMRRAVDGVLGVQDIDVCRP